MGAGTVQNGAAQGGVSPGIGNDDSLHTGENAVFIAGGGELHLHGVALYVIVQGLLTAVLHLDGLFRRPRHQRGILLHGHILLAAEATADKRRAAMHLFLWDLQHLGALPLHIVNRLAGRVDQQTVRSIRHGYAAFWLHKAVLLPAGFILAGDHVF